MYEQNTSCFFGVLVTRLPIRLDDTTMAALIKLAQQEFRDPRSQASLIIRQELVRIGLLSQENENTKEDLHIDTK